MLNNLVKYQASLAVDSLEFDAHIGVSEKERSKPQKIRVSLELFFRDYPDICADEDAEFICYDKLAKAIISYVTSREFRFIEFLVARLIEVIKAEIANYDMKGDIKKNDIKNDDIKMAISVEKVNPPVDYRLGSVSFAIDTRAIATNKRDGK